MHIQLIKFKYLKKLLMSKVFMVLNIELILIIYKSNKIRKINI